MIDYNYNNDNNRFVLFGNIFIWHNRLFTFFYKNTTYNYSAVRLRYDDICFVRKNKRNKEWSGR